MSEWKDWCDMRERNDSRDPRPEGTYLQPIFRDHNCGACDNGKRPCREGNYNNCSYPHARND